MTNFYLGTILLIIIIFVITIGIICYLFGSKLNCNR